MTLLTDRNLTSLTSQLTVRKILPNHDGVIIDVPTSNGTREFRTITHGQHRRCFYFYMFSINDGVSYKNMYSGGQAPPYTDIVMRSWSTKETFEFFTANFSGSDKIFKVKYWIFQEGVE